MPRRMIQDLIARYQLEPQMTDVYVEGCFDEKVLHLYFAELKCERPGVNVIDLVEIPDAILEKYNLSRGKKTELLALAAEIHSCLGEIRGFTAVVDADFDRLVGVVNPNPLVLTTDFTCMEMYWIDEITIQRFFTWIGEQGKGLADFLADISKAARDLFLIRCSLMTLRTGAPMIPIRKHCLQAGNTLALDKTKYCRHILTSAGLAHREAEVHAEIEKLEALAGENPKHCIQGHDFIELVYLAYKKPLKRVGLTDAESVQTMIKMTMPIQHLAGYRLFQQLRDRAC